MRVSNENLIGEIHGIFAEKWAIHVESPEVDLLDTGLVDSLTLVELLLELEHRFGVSLPLEELEIDDFRSIARIADLVTRMRPPHEAPGAAASALPTSRPQNAISATGAAA